MKHVFRLFALMAVFLMGSVTTEASKTLTYDFMANHPTSQVRIDQGHKEVIGNIAYWTGSWAGLFGRKIGFATDSYPVLHQNGGLVDYHSSRKTYVMNLSVGDKVTFVYTGTNPSVQFHTSGTARISGLELYDTFVSGNSYTVTTAGNLCVLTHWSADGDVTIINRIVIESVKETETVDISNGMSTYCCTNPLDFSTTSNLKAYVAIGFDNGKFIFKQVNYVPSNTGFLVVSQGGDAATANIPVGRSSNYKENTIDGNLFRGYLASVSVYLPYGKAGYAFGVANGEVGIYRINTGFVCRPNKAILLVDELNSYPGNLLEPAI